MNRFHSCLYFWYYKNRMSKLFLRRRIICFLFQHYIFGLIITVNCRFPLMIWLPSLNNRCLTWRNFGIPYLWLYLLLQLTLRLYEWFSRWITCNFFAFIDSTLIFNLGRWSTFFWNLLWRNSWIVLFKLRIIVRYLWLVLIVRARKLLRNNIWLKCLRCMIIPCLLFEYGWNWIAIFLQLWIYSSSCCWLNNSFFLSFFNLFLDSNRFFKFCLLYS